MLLLLPLVEPISLGIFDHMMPQASVVSRQPYHAAEPLRCGLGIHESGIGDYLTPQYAMVLITRGGGRWRHGPDTPWAPFTVGDVFQRRPEEPHQVAYQAGTRSRHVAVPASVYDLLADLHLPTLDQAVLHIGDPSPWVRRHDELGRALLRAPYRQLPALLTSLQAWMVDLHLAANAGSPVWLESACSALADQGRTIAAIAHDCGVSEPTFRRQFTRHTGRSPGRWRRDLVMEAARNRLAAGETPGAVAAALGFTDGAAFSRAFHNATGSSPNRYAGRNFSR